MNSLPGGIPRILIVDDEPAIRNLLSMWLTRSGYACAHADSVPAAQAWLAKEEAELVTCDISMPGTSGLELLTWLKVHAPLTQVLMLSGAGDTKIAIQSLMDGAAGYLFKPLQRDELLIHVQRGLERRRLLLQQRRYTEQLEQRVAEQTRAIRQAQEEMIHRLVNATMFRDEETGAHIRRTGLFSEILALHSGWTREQAQQIRLAAPMHDIGKIAIPDAVLRKPGRLTRQEFETMMQHTTIGARMLADSSCPVLQMAHDIAMSHHEHWNGHGYPAGKSGANIPEAARIVSIVDVYDALTHDRVYRPALPRAEVIELMQRGAGRQFDPTLLEVFFTILPEIDRLALENPDVQEELGSWESNGFNAQDWVVTTA